MPFFKRRAFPRRAGKFRGKRSFKRRRVFKKRPRRGNRTKMLANRLRKFMTELKWTFTQSGTRAAPTAFAAGVIAFSPVLLARGNGNNQREGERVIFKKYTWRGQIGGARMIVGKSDLQHALWELWELVIYWKGDTTAVVADPNIIFHNNGTNHQRIEQGFAVRYRRNFDVLFSRKHRMRATGNAAIAFSPLAEGGVCNGWNGISGAVQKWIKGSITLKPRNQKSRWQALGAVPAETGRLMHYFIQGIETIDTVTKPNVWMESRYSFYDD